MKLRIVVIILLTDQPKEILSTAHTTKVKLPLPKEDFHCQNSCFKVRKIQKLKGPSVNFYSIEKNVSFQRRCKNTFFLYLLSKNESNYL